MGKNDTHIVFRLEYEFPSLFQRYCQKVAFNDVIIVVKFYGLSLWYRSIDLQRTVIIASGIQHWT
jgi:hypothetical protein